MSFLDVLRSRVAAGTLVLWTRRTTMKRNKWTPDEWRAYKTAREARIKQLRDHVERIRAELDAKRRTKPA
jgi:hypothetical protein